MSAAKKRETNHAAGSSTGAGHGKVLAAGNSSNRLIRNFTLFDNRDFLPRTFQIELYEACKSRDTIVFLRPGNGKHFITVMLIKYFAPSTSGEPRKVFFLTKSLNSIRLYASVFRAHTDFCIVEQQQPEPHYDEAKWRTNLAGHDIHLMLDTTFERLLAQGLVGLEHIKLLVLDDVHKIIIEDGDECYTRIMRTLRAAGLERNSSEYRVLGLSASILIEGVSSRVFESMIERIEQQLSCTCETYADLRMINKYAVPCRISLRFFPSQFMDHFTRGQIDPTQLQWSLFKIRNYVAQYYEFLNQLQDSKLSEQAYLVTQESLSQAVIDVVNVLGTLGEWCALRLIDLYNREIIDTISLLKATRSNYVKLLNSIFYSLQLVRRSILAYLPADIRDKLEGPDCPSKKTGRLTLAQLFFLSTPKLHLLAQLLADYLAELRGSSPIQSTFSFPANICAIIYAERRCTVRIVAAWLAELAAITADAAPSHPFAHLLPDYVFLKDEDRASGASSIYTQKQQQKSLHEIFYYRRQEEVLKRFRFAHNCNLLVTSSMSAEGLDINRCNLVLCFDPPRSFQAYIMSKGRVRSENGLFYVLVDRCDSEEANYGDKFRQFVEIEKIFTKLVPLANELTIEEATDSQQTLRFDVESIQAEPGTVASPAANPAPATSTGVQLTMENAISILNRYCLKLPSDTFTKLAPHYYIDAVTNAEGQSRYQCRLYLPINSAFRDEIRGDAMSNRVMAKRSAAFKAVKTLQELGELDGNFYPIGKETSRYIEKLGLQDCFITTARAAESASSTSAPGSLLPTGPATHKPGNRYNRLQARNIASKRRLYYQKKVANYLSAGSCFKEVAPKRYLIEHLYEFEMALTTPLPEEQNIRGRPLVDPAQTKRTFGIVVPCRLPPVCDFTIYNRSGEVTVRVRRIEANSAVNYTDEQIEQLKTFHTYTIEGVLRLGKNSIKAAFDGGASNGNYVIVPVNETTESRRDIDWAFVASIVKHTADQETAVAAAPKPAERFHFDAELYRDAVIIPKYRRDKMQAFFYVAMICDDLTPLSSFPDHGFATFEEYYRLKYGLTITNLEQPLLDVDHTSTRLNLLTPRYLNRKGGMDPTMAAAIGALTSGNKKTAKKQPNLQQKQILVPELCTIHPFPASFWRKAVCLPCMLYRLNSLLVAEELRHQIAREANIGQVELPDGANWPSLDFGWSLIVKQAAKKLESEKAAVAAVKNGKPQVASKAKPALAAEVTPALATSTTAISGFAPLPDSVTGDPFSSMGDWTSFMDSVSAQRPELFQPLPAAEIEIISFGTATDPSVAIPDDFAKEDPELAMLQAQLARKESEEPAIVEVDDAGNAILERPMRIGSPTQFDDDEEDEEVEEEDGDNYEVDLVTDWTAPLEDSDSEMVVATEQRSGVTPDKFEVDLDGLSKDLENLAVCEDDEFLADIQQDFDDAASYSDYSDFDVEDLDEDEEFSEVEEEEDDFSDLDLDEDEELFGDEDDDEEDEAMPRRRGGNKKKRASNKKTDGATGYKAKSFIYDVLRYELLYDCKTFERVNKTPKLLGGDGSALLNVDRQNRAGRNRRIYERIYREEKEQVLLCTEKVAAQLEEKENANSCSYQGESLPSSLDRTAEAIPLTAEVRFVDVVFDKFHEDEVYQRTRLIEGLEGSREEEELIPEEELRQDPKTLMANYGLMKAAGEEEVKFGELLPNRGSADEQQGAQETPPGFSFDAAPTQATGPDPSLILQAITMSNSSDGINLERLETVGDSFLKYSITAFLFCMCPDLNEGKLSFLRSRQISNINLHRLGQHIQLGQMMIASKFEPNDNWCPPGYKVLEEPESGSTVDKNKVPYNLLTQHSIPNKSIADCVEALIGTYLIASGSQGAIHFMDWLGLKVLPKDADRAANVWLPMPKSPLIVPKDSSPEVTGELRRKLNDIYQQHRLDRFEAAIGYTFRDKAYLVQAFTHNSYFENTVTPCYQRLEFLGDAVLDYLITRYLYEDPRCHSPGTLTDLRSALVNNTFFASLAVKYSFNKYLMMLSHELFRVVDGFVRKFNLCNTSRIEEEQKRQKRNAGEWQHEDEPSQRSCVYWELFISENEAEHLEDIEVPKALGDIFESVAGAIFLDSGMSLDAVWRAYYPMMKPEIEYFSFCAPKSPIRVLLEKQPQSAKFGKPEITSGRKIRVSVEVFNVGKFVGVGRNKRIAKCTAAKRALRALKVLDDHAAKRLADVAASFN